MVKLKSLFVYLVDQNWVAILLTVITHCSLFSHKARIFSKLQKTKKFKIFLFLN